MHTFKQQRNPSLGWAALMLAEEDDGGEGVRRGASSYSGLCPRPGWVCCGTALIRL